MSNLAAAKNAINYIIGKSKTIKIDKTGAPRGSTEPVVVPDNCIFIYTNGFVAVNNIVPPTINFILEGGGIDWEGALVQENIFPYYSPAQLSTLNTLINYCTTLNKNLYIDSDFFI